MTSRRQRLANRINGQRSKGPKTDAGKRSSSINSMKHGLTVPIELSYWAIHLWPMTEMLLSEGLSETEARLLAISILDYERNLEHQKQLFLTYQARHCVMDNLQANQKSDFKSLLADPELVQWEQKYPWVRQKMNSARLRYLIHLQTRKFRQVRKDRLQAQVELRNADRHLRRATNQLQRRLRNL